MKRAPDRSALELAHASLDAALDQLAAYVRGEGHENAARALFVETGRNLDGQRPPPPVAVCDVCGAILGQRSRVHAARVTDVRPCPGSWR